MVIHLSAPCAKPHPGRAGCWFRAALFGLLVAGCPVAATAAEPPNFGRTRLGPLYLTFSVKLTAGVDDNVYNAATTTVSDESVTLVPSIEGVLPLSRRARIRATGGLAPHFFATEREERHTDRLGSLGAELDLGPLSLASSRGVGRFRQRFSVEIDERLVRDETTTMFGATLRVRRISVTATRRLTRSTFEPGRDGAPVNFTLDRDSTTDRVELSLPLTRRTTFVPSVDLVEDRFLHALPGLSPSVDSQRYRLALQFGKLAFITGRIAGGIQRFEEGQGVAPYSGAFVEVNAGMPFVLGTRLAFDAKRDVTYAATPAADPLRRNTAVSSVYTGELQFGLFWNMHGRGFTSRSTFDYLSSPTVDGTTGRADHVWRHGGAVLRRLGDYLSVGLMAERTDRTSVVNGRSYRAWSYGVTGELRY